MDKLVVIKILLVVVIIVLLVIFHQFNRETKACFGRYCYKVEIARTQTERERGLMFRDKLDRNRGMFFVFDREDFYPFWMKNTLIPLDIIWLDKDYKVAYIFKNAQPCGEECENIVPDKPAQYVLELSAGEADRVGLGIKDKFNFNN